MLEWALNENFELEFIDNADSTQHKYFCSECRSLLSVKNRNFEGRVKVKHFAHNFGQSCAMSGSSGESFLHVNTKLLLYKRLTQGQGCPVYIKTKIGEAVQYIEVNLLQGVDKVELEKKSLDGKFIPDISLYQNGRLTKTVEIVHTHRDTIQKTQSYEHNDIRVFSLFTSELVYKRLKRGSLPVLLVGKQSLSKLLR